MTKFYWKEFERARFNEIHIRCFIAINSFQKSEFPVMVLQLLVGIIVYHVILAFEMQ
jgi:hypothetical protein